MKVVYLYDGTPYLVELDVDGEYNYPKEAWTETPPPEGIYEPFYFNGNKWSGSTKQEYENNLENNISDTPNSNDLLNAQLLANDLEHNSKIKALEEDIANLTAQLLKMQERDV